MHRNRNSDFLRNRQPLSIIYLAPAVFYQVFTVGAAFPPGGQALPYGLEAGLEAAARRLIYGSFVRCWEAAPTNQPPVWCTKPFLTPQ